MRSTHPAGSRAALHVAALTAVAVALGASAGWAQHTSGVFSGVKVNGGTVTHASANGKQVLTLSADFKAPEAPDPHWQIVDSKGRVYLLGRLVVKEGDKKDSMQLVSRIELPAWVPDVAKVQIWCAYAEALLGEASFQKPVM
jgi:hypothetical protein